ncbi:MAG: 23S rRNA (pseudouridine(1915)-N(3))-methyltransferase RlmH [Bacilli bacterium]
MTINLICIGKIKEKYIRDGIEEYLKRLSSSIKVNIIELKEFNTDDTSKNMEEEGKLILNQISNDYVVTLEIDGLNIDSVALSEMIFDHYIYNSNVISFIIGGSSGLSDEVKSRSNFKLSFGKMTYPHQLMRLILIEQVYRSFMIKSNSKYHK